MQLKIYIVFFEGLTIEKATFAFSPVNPKVTYTLLKIKQQVCEITRQTICVERFHQL